MTGYSSGFISPDESFLNLTFSSIYPSSTRIMVEGDSVEMQCQSESSATGRTIEWLLDESLVSDQRTGTIKIHQSQKGSLLTSRIQIINVGVN